jgi:glutamate:GABA antiporter
LAAHTHRLSALDATLYGISIAVGIRWIAVAAAVGPASLPMWILAFITFFIPLAAATAELTARVDDDGGVYAWCRDILGPFAGFICGWFYWISLIPYFASTLVFLGGLAIAAFGGDPKNATLYVIISIGVSLLVTGVQLAGLKYGKWLPNIGTAGAWIVVIVIIGIGIVIGARGQSATSFSEATYLPPFNFDTALLWGTMVFGFCGVEAIAFFRSEIVGGVRTIARVLVIVGVSATIIFIIGTAAFLIILPQTELSRLAGFPDALRSGLDHVGLGGLGPTVVGLFALSMLGGFTAWFGVGARLPFAAGIDAFLPSMFSKKNPTTGAPVTAILFQGALMLVMVLLSQTGTSVAGAYDFLVAMSVLTVAIPYVIMFIAYFRASRLSPVPGAWAPPGGARTSASLAVVGLLSTIVAIACTLVPSPAEPHPVAAFLKILIAATVMLGVGVAIYQLAATRRTRRGLIT